MPRGHTDVLYARKRTNADRISKHTRPGSDITLKKHTMSPARRLWMLKRSSEKKFRSNCPQCSGATHKLRTAGTLYTWALSWKQEVRAQMPDVRRRVALATPRFGELRHIWHDGDLHINLRMRLYKDYIKRVCVRFSSTDSRHGIPRLMWRVC